jgi:hypothetical protein
MATFTVEFLSRDEQGRFKRERRTINAVDAEEAESYVRHGARHGKWALEGPITIDGPVGSRRRERTVVGV